MTSETILVLGATGTLGGATVDGLLERGARVRALVRSAERGQKLKARGVELALGDLSSADSLVAALDRVGRVCVLLPGNPYQPDQLALGDNVVHALKKRPVAHLVYHSMWGAGRSVHRPPVMQNHAAMEDRLLSTGVACTFLQNIFTMQALLAQGIAQSVARDGRIYTPFGEAGYAFVDARDVGQAAAVCLTSDAHKGKTYELSGPEVLTANDVAKIVGAVVGRAVANVPLTVADAMAALTRMGLPEWFTAQMAALAGYNRTGALARTTPGIEELTGRAPRRFEQFVREHAAAFAG